MKKTILALVAMVVVCIGSAMPTAAQLRFGVKAGIDVNSLHLNSKLFDTDNRAGFTGGVMLEFNAPVINLGFDVSAMYVRRNLKATYPMDIDNNNQVVNGSMTSHRDYINIPLNIKYKIGIPGVSKVFQPFITTGPAVAFLTSKTAINDAFKNKTVDCTWNFGFGAELISHLQIHAQYGIGLSKSIVDKFGFNEAHIDGKTRCWTITAAYLF